jgi:diguanylate cyclase (GGDEF)-like protein
MTRKKENNMDKSRTIFKKIFVPVLAILLIVVGLFMLFINSYILKNLRTNIFAAYEEQIANHKNYLESSLLRKQNALNQGAEQVRWKIEELVKAKGYKLSDIRYNADLNQDILDNMADSIIDTLSISDATDIFLILDGYGSYDNTQMRAGIYIRNSEPGTYVPNYGNLIYERGISTISKRLKLPLDIYWQPGFLFEDEESSDFFFRPLLKAKESGSLNFRNFAYWTYIINERDFGVLSCSVPLIGSKGEVFGVMGIGINENNLMKGYSYNGLNRNSSRAYILAKTTDGLNYKPYFIKGEYYDKASILSQNISLPSQSENGVFYVNTGAPYNDEICLNSQELKLYSYNGPFENEKWALLGIQKTDELLANYYFVENSLSSIMLIAALICIVCVFLFSRFISVPIQQMVSSLRKSDPNTPIRLQKTYIDEIDELAESIENLSARLSKRIEKERDYDILTNLLSRRGFENRLRQLVKRQVDLKTGAMLVWDLDDLKLINDNFGHCIGDNYLIAFANCLKKFNCENVISARRSGDEFVTFIYGYDSIEEIEILIEEIWKVVNSTYIDLSGHHRSKINISMGKAWYPKDSDDFDTLFLYADSAMYEAKNKKKRDLRNVITR